MSYSGNSSLSRDVQQRVLDTFEQTLNLAAEGSRQEALLGCDFVLRMDPQFEPARRLQDRLRASSGAIVDLDDLRPSAPITAPPDLFASVDGLGLDLPDLPPDSFAPDLHAEARELLEQRRFEEMTGLALQHGPTIGADPELRALFQLGQDRMEAEPYVQKFAGQARAALQAGQADEVSRLLDKARSLDPSHPALAGIEAELHNLGGSMPRAPLDVGAIPAEMAGFDLGFDTPSDSDPRIQQLLDEGQRAFEQGDPQGAIDAWSRIFLIDIDHPEAARRIESARKLKAESERQVEEVFHDGVSRLEAGDQEAARQIFQKVLEIQPGYTAAREYLQQIEAGKAPVVPRSAGPSAAPAAPSMAASAASAADTLLPMESLGPIDDLKEEILVPPDPSELAAAERKSAPKAGKVRAGRARQTFVMVGSLVLLLVLAGGWYVFQNRDQFFPNSQTEGGPGSPRTDTIAEAQALHASGKTSRAISLLRRVPSSDTQYQQAQALIAQWEATLEPKTGAPVAAAPGPAPAPVIPAPQAALLTAAHEALAEGSRMQAVEYFEQAAKMGKLGPEETALLASAREQLQPLSRQIDLFQQHEWDFILNDLWRMHEENPGDRDVTRLIVDSYYNLGIRDLQRSDPVKAEDKFKEALRLAPEDALLKRHHQFAQTYQDRPKDLLYRIYVKYLALR